MLKGNWRARTEEAGQPFRRVIVVVDGPNPSYDYFLAQTLFESGVPVVLAQLHDGARQLAPALFEGALLLFCRYVTPSWLRLMEQHRRKLAAVVLFLDDDLEALHADSSVPLLHRLRYWWLGPAQWRRFSPLLDRLLVASPELARRHSRLRPCQLPVQVAPHKLRAPADEGDVIAYHGGIIHRGEHLWLVPVVRELIAAMPEVRFEVTARGSAAAAWLRCPGVTVMPHWPWPDYCAASSSRGISLMLAPTLPTAANAARCWTKRIDAARAGAALLVSDASLYQVSTEEAELGMRVELNPAAWREAITALLNDRQRLRRLAYLNQQRIRQLQANQPSLFEHAGEGLWRLRQGAGAVPTRVNAISLTQRVHLQPLGCE